jgi:uncharacterized membrane protein YedE/YeeE
MNGDGDGNLYACKRSYRWALDRARRSVHVVLNGRIAGISGIVGGLVNTKANDTGWRVAFVLGFPLGALVYILVAGARAGGRARISAGHTHLGAAGRFRHPHGFGLHQRPRSVRPRASLVALGCRHGGVLRGVHAHRLPGQARLLMAVLRTFASLVCGLVFGLGLAVSGMMNPAKVIGI